MNKLLWMHCFVRTVETGSFSAVARELGMGQPNVSRHIAALEKDLGTRLLHRSTRQLVATPEGQRYYLQARQALDVISQAESDVRGQQNPRGLLRVATSSILGNEVIMDAVPAFLARYPDIELEFRLSDSFVDLVAEGVDIAIRGGVLKDSALRAKRVGTSERVYVASAAYLEQHGTPQQPSDLAQHECIVYTLLTGGGSWPFKHGEVAVSGRLRTDSIEGVRRAMLANIGITYLPTWMVAAQLRSGTVKAVLTDHTCAPAPINAVYSASRLLPQRATVFLEFISATFLTTPGLNGESLL
ncbi:LysR family transcriptional regulator [Pseudoduganella sp. FT55W]|uniref:LysR family transcriptional regulator n=1 Tax=Duganella rivi TaxID=2666083 RepID=A0A7X4GP16_9BURK|nr:LysR family transcriptional regulator [Duganella rivi]MYM67065.1 LysR family transcriptional regulator [Duganella rivi]